MSSAKKEIERRLISKLSMYQYVKLKLGLRKTIRVKTGGSVRA